MKRYNDFYILSDSFVRLAALDSRGIKWRTERLAWDRDMIKKFREVSGEAMKNNNELVYYFSL